MVEIDLPAGWTARDDRVRRTGQFPLAENDNGVTVGVKQGANGSWSVWAGTGPEPREQTTVASVLDTESDAKLKALTFMQDYPRADVEDHGGFVRVLDRRGRAIRSV